MSDDVVQHKKALRKQVRARLKELDKDTIQKQSQQVWDRLFALPQYQSAQSVGLFLSMPKCEIDTDPALKHAMDNGKRIYVPEVGKNFELADMELVQVVVDEPTKDGKKLEEKGEDSEPSTKKAKTEEKSDKKETKDTANNKSDKDPQEKIFHHNWPRNKWGIPEPPPTMPIVTAKPGDIDVLVVPGLAFDRNGDRLGQGKGYYDRFIERMCKDSDVKAPFLVAVGLQAQVIDENIPVAEYDRRMDMVLLPEEAILVTK